MVEQSPAISVKDILGCIRARLDGAVAVARAAEACADAGDVERALTIMLDVEQPLCEVTRCSTPRACCIGAQSLDGEMRRAASKHDSLRV